MKLFTVVTLLASFAAADYQPCGTEVDKPNHAKCCAVHELLDISLFCTSPQIDPINREDFDTVCGDQTPVCCKYNVLGLAGIKCEEPAEDPEEPTGYQCTDEMRPAARCCRRNALTAVLTCEEEDPIPPPEDVDQFRALCEAKPNRARAYCCKLTSDGTFSFDCKFAE